MTKTFEEWMKVVDTICESKYGLSVDDLPDCCYKDWYDDDVKPSTAAARAIKGAAE
jgi:hypothetical protein